MSVIIYSPYPSQMSKIELKVYHILRKYLLRHSFLKLKNAFNSRD